MDGLKSSRVEQQVRAEALFLFTGALGLFQPCRPRQSFE